jgi:tripartite-type tricarboxylate transporter receptor subunit TctC
MNFAVRALLLALPLLLGLLGPAAAQDYPSRDIHIICGYPAGSGADIYVRYFADALRGLSGKAVVVENKAGATGSIGAEAVARSRPDGYTLLISPGGALSYNVHLFKKLNYDPLTDLAPITTLIRFPFLLVVDPSTQVTDVKGLIDRLKLRKEKAAFGASAAVAIALGEMLKSAANVEATKVLYRGAPESLQDLKEGSLDFIFLDPAFGIEQSRQGRVRTLAVTTPQRSYVLPEIPTMAEAGYPSIDRTSWFAAMAPAGTPPPIIEKINGWYRQIMAADEAKKFFATSGADAFVGTPQDLARLQRDEIAKWTELVKLAKIEPQ